MFDNIKQMNKIREMQKDLSKERLESTEDGVTVIMNGKMEVEEIKITEDMDKEKLERVLKSCFNSCLKNVQMAAAKKMQEMGGF